MTGDQIRGLFDLRGRIAVVTGGGGDLCGNMCLALGALGVKVAVLDLKLEKAEAIARAVGTNGGKARAFACSVLDTKAMQEHCDAIRKMWGAPDILINGAGGNDPRGSTTVEFVEKNDQIPSAVWLGSKAVPPESYLVALGRVTNRLIVRAEPPENVTVPPAHLAVGQFVADDSPKLWGWVIFPQGFQAPKMMGIARLQAWTFKPARAFGSR